ncbi:TPA_asm: hypothetical protein GIO55_14325, partial [Listeria monocytogenes]|nr:hypothetical protein [Listeria monocytogenes]
MNHSDDDEYIMIQQNIDTRAEIVSGVGIKQLFYLMFSIPIYPLIYYFPFFHHENPTIDTVIRFATCICVFILAVLFVQMRPIKNAKITGVEIVAERLSFKR